MKLLSWIASFATVACAFAGFWGLHYINVDCNWVGVIISLAVAMFFWSMMFVCYQLTEYAESELLRRRRGRKVARNIKLQLREKGEL